MRFHHLPDQDEKPEDEKPKEFIKRIVYEFKKKHKQAIQASKTYLRLLQYVRPYWYLALTVLILSAFSSLTSILPAQITGVAIDQIWSAGKSALNENNIDNQIQPTSSATRGKTLTIEPIIRKATDYVSVNWMPNKNRFIVTFGVLAMAFLGFHLLGQGISVANGFIMTKLGNTLTFDMRNNIYNHLQNLSLKFFEDRRTGDLMSRAVNDVDSLQDVIVGPVIWFITDMLRLFWVLYLCISWDWELTGLSLLVTPLLIFATLSFGIYMRKKYLLLRQKIGDLNAVIQDNISGIRTIK
jgi:subfamily B ATP-binding cassette protein MsbA